MYVYIYWPCLYLKWLLIFPLRTTSWVACVKFKNYSAITIGLWWAHVDWFTRAWNTYAIRLTIEQTCLRMWTQNSLSECSECLVNTNLELCNTICCSPMQFWTVFRQTTVASSFLFLLIVIFNCFVVCFICRLLCEERSGSSLTYSSNIIYYFIM